ncbi:MAG: hypothetical protein LBO67_08290 [Spirochaetaceae bacterium]|jgi:phage shock protein A|nr:hypothetical protein [Spirochaetaceae bacterium]
MSTVEHINLLETKLVKVLDFAKQVIAENAHLKTEVELYRKQLTELGEEQSHIREGVLSLVDRLSQFEELLSKDNSTL